MEIWGIWLIVVGVLLVIELLTQTIWALCLAMGCLLSMFVSILGLNLNCQIITLLFASVATYIILGVFLKGRKVSLSKSDTRTGMEALLGRKAIVTNEIKPGHLGRARIDGDNWQVRAPGVGAVIPRGTEVYVTGYDSIILDVAIQ